MADDENFDIDIYGDGEGMDEDSKAFYKQENEKKQALEEEARVKAEVKLEPEPADSITEANGDVDVFVKREVSEDRKQGVKRKGESDERRIDPAATNALLVSELHWWTTEDDIRGWVNDAGAEDELKEITFSEHKVNGKSKGQAFLEFLSPQASTAAKHQIETVTSGPSNSRKFTVAFSPVSPNPFKTLPKDAPARAKEDRGSTSHSGSSHRGSYNSDRPYRGRGGFNNRGSGAGGGFHRGGFNNNNNNINHNFSGGMGGMGGMGGFGNGPNFQAGMPMMNNFPAFNNRGGMMGPMRGGVGGRGGRGGMNSGMMMPMMNPMMMGAIGPQGFGGNASFNPGMFQAGGPGMDGSDWNHGAKRQRQD